ncbi:hypothetical protein PGB90_000448 [Kerria lacca]
MESTNEGNLDNLYLALTKCFAIIICGYVAGRTHMIMQRETSGLNTFVGKFSLPSLIFISLCKLDLSAVNWLFILAIFVAKSIIFFLVLIITVLVTRPTNTARSGILAIFCTQTNDFAIGVPIVTALYEKSHPELVAYLYLLAPISLTILNPFGFVMMEIGRQPAIASNVENGTESNYWQMIRSVIRNIVTNPIVFMTALGIIGNLVFNHNPPVILKSVLDIFGDAFTGTSLMLLGLRMVGRVHTLQGTRLVIPSLLIITKLLLTPLLMREIVDIFLQYQNKEDKSDFTTFSFLYGLIPSAPGVFVYATAYALDVDLIAASMVACTFLSAPLMFISAKMITASIMDKDHTVLLLKSYEFDISLLSFIGGIVVFLVFVMNHKFRFPHRLTLLLTVVQIIACVGSILEYCVSLYLLKIIQIFSDIIDGPLIENVDCNENTNQKYYKRENVTDIEEDLQLIRHFILLVFMACSFIVCKVDIEKTKWSSLFYGASAVYAILLCCIRLLHQINLMISNIESYSYNGIIKDKFVIFCFLFYFTVLTTYLSIFMRRNNRKYQSFELEIGRIYVSSYIKNCSILKNLYLKLLKLTLSFINFYEFLFSLLAYIYINNLRITELIFYLKFNIFLKFYKILFRKKLYFSLYTHFYLIQIFLLYLFFIIRKGTLQSVSFSYIFLIISRLMKLKNIEQTYSFLLVIDEAKINKLKLHSHISLKKRKRYIILEKKQICSQFLMDRVHTCIKRFVSKFIHG